MTLADQEAELDKISAQIQAVPTTPWQPLCIQRAFIPDLVFVGPFLLKPVTMEGWLRLEKSGSPFITGEWPEADKIIPLVEAVTLLAGTSRTVEEFLLVVRPEEAAAAHAKISVIIREAFSTALKMRKAAVASSSADGGFGWWIVLFASLLADGISRAEILQLPIVEAFALSAAIKYVKGWEPAGMPYKTRDLVDELSEAAETQEEA